MMTEMTPKMRICMSTLQETSLDKEGMGPRKFGKSLLLFWRERERERESERERERERESEREREREREGERERERANKYR